MQDNFADQECRLDLTGSDVVEEFWSMNGQWEGNHHNYNFGDLRRNTSHMIRLEQIRVDPHAPEFAKPHPKQESIWAKQYAVGYEKVRLDEYPAPGVEIDAWKEGTSVAQCLARSVGIAPDNLDSDNSDDDGDGGGGDGDGSDGDGDGSGGGDGGDGDDGGGGCGGGGGGSDSKHKGNGGDDWFYYPFRYPGNHLY